MDTFPYFAVAGLLALAAIVSPRQKVSPIAWTLAFVLLVVFVGLRHKVGMDWNNYLRMTEFMASGTLLESFSRAEPAFALLTWLSAKAGFGVYGVNLVAAVIFCAGLFRFCRKTDNPWLGLLVAFPMLIMVVACSASRQSVAIGILMWLIAEWRESTFAKRVVLILAACMFHYSAAFLLCFVALELDVRPRFKIAAFLGTVAGTAWLMLVTGGGDYYINTYVTDQSDLVYSPGAIQHVLLNAAPASLVVFGKRVRDRLFPTRILLNLAIMALALVPVVLVSSVAAGRLSLYLFPVSIFVVTRLAGMTSSPHTRAIARILISAGLVFICWFWLTYSNSGFAYSPYENAILMHESALHL